VSRNSLSYFITFGCLSLLVSGCGGDAPKPSNSASPSLAASLPAPAPSGVSPAFTQPPLTAKAVDPKSASSQPNFSGDIAAGLIPASDAEAATKAVAKGRIDPFSTVIAQPNALRAIGQVASRPAIQPATIGSGNSVTPVSTTSPAIRSGNNLGAASVASMMTKKSAGKKLVAKKLIAKIAIVPKTIASKGKTSNPVVAPVGSIPATLPLVPAKTALLTPPAQPELAQSIQVSGVSEINGQVQVVMQLPGESFSRYISVGEKILNGKVLIKRVQDRNAITPIVVLEEAGIEVLRRVGEKPLVAIKNPTEAAK
jgi:hypothetical protein